MKVHAKASELGQSERGICDAAVVVLLSRMRRKQRHNGLLDIDAVHDRAVEPDDGAVDADAGWAAGNEEQIAALPRHDLAKQRLDVEGALVRTCGAARSV